MSLLRTHHSHSGEFCSHGRDTLKGVIQQAIDLGFKSIVLTEHIPRYSANYLYPEESNLKICDLFKKFDNYYKAAKVLQRQLKDQINISVGFESEFFGPQDKGFVRYLKEKYDFKIFVGSIHYVHDIPIDFSKELFDKARRECGENATEEDLFAAYFDLQYEMIRDLRPPIIGHFDLIRLYASNSHSIDFRAMPRIQAKIERNVKEGVKIGSLFEINSAGLKRKLPFPYPAEDVLSTIQKYDGKFCISDDSHAIDQVGLHYKEVYLYLTKMGVNTLYYVTSDDNSAIIQSEQIM